MTSILFAGLLTADAASTLEDVAMLEIGVFTAPEDADYPALHDRITRQLTATDGVRALATWHPAGEPATWITVTAWRDANAFEAATRAFPSELSAAFGAAVPAMTTWNVGPVGVVTGDLDGGTAVEVAVYAIRDDRLADFASLHAELLSRALAADGALGAITARDRDDPRIFVDLVTWSSTDAQKRFSDGLPAALKERYAAALETSRFYAVLPR
ncbi:MAG: hypothetical protein AAF602_23665 [Myxococcota bacterium]